MKKYRDFLHVFKEDIEEAVDIIGYSETYDLYDYAMR